MHFLGNENLLQIDNSGTLIARDPSVERLEAEIKKLKSSIGCPHRTTPNFNPQHACFCRECGLQL